MDHRTNTKVYKFDLSQFKKNSFKKLIALCIFIVVFYGPFLYALYMTTKNGSPFLRFISILSNIILLYFMVVKEFVAYFRADKIHEDDSVTVYKENEHIVCVDIKIQETKYDEFYSIQKITQLHRKNYIDVEGEIYNGSSSDVATDLRIPPYFEDMGEIYSELERLKDQPSTL